ncbi:MAG: hypothetical protein IPP94_08905 [Ignavibacteria bacterium]|nr:hypothetical protein [Ignavibacteria bacterium]
MKTFLLAFLALSATLSAQTLWDKAQYGDSRADLLKTYPDAVKSDVRGASAANGSDLIITRDIGKYRYAVIMRMIGDKLDAVSIKPVTAASMDMYRDMIYSIIEKHGGGLQRGNDMRYLLWWNTEDKQVRIQAEYAAANGLPWTVNMEVRCALAKSDPSFDESGGC